MNACDVVGYVCDGEINCPDCCEDPEGCDPIFADSETDCPDNCSACGRPIENTLTDEGAEYVRQCLRQTFRRGKRGNQALRHNGPAYYVGSDGGAVVLDWIDTYGVRLTGWDARAVSVLRCQS